MNYSTKHDAAIFIFTCSQPAHESNIDSIKKMGCSLLQQG